MWGFTEGQGLGDGGGASLAPCCFGWFAIAVSHEGSPNAFGRGVLVRHALGGVPSYRLFVSCSLQSVRDSGSSVLGCAEFAPRTQDFGVPVNRL